MIKIKIKTSFRIELEDTQVHEFSLDKLEERKSIVSHNKLVIIENAYTIESKLEYIIGFYFFGRHEINKEKAKAFDGQILKSNWCNFESKRKLLSFILDDLSVFEIKKDKDEFEKNLRKVMSYRNSFTHGQLTYTRDRVKIKWFEGITHEKFLTDDYLAQIEVDFIKCFDSLNNVTQKIIETDMTGSVNKPLAV